ncbi:19637_t:CDS:1, partial [Racocetra persica]
AILKSTNSALTTNRFALPSWLDNSIINAINWLKDNNPYLCRYSQIISSNLTMHYLFPSASHLLDNENTSPVQ